MADRNVSEDDMWTSEPGVRHGHPLRRAPSVTRACEAEHSTIGSLSLSRKRSRPIKAIKQLWKPKRGRTGDIADTVKNNVDVIKRSV